MPEEKNLKPKVPDFPAVENEFRTKTKIAEEIMKPIVPDYSAYALAAISAGHGAFEFFKNGETIPLPFLFPL